MLRRVALVLALASCHHDPEPATAETAPLPPASGTPIGFLIDDASALQLTGDQLARLHQIDTALAAQLETLDSKLRTANKPADTSSSDPPPTMGRHGGRRGGMGGMGGGHSRHRGSGSGSAAPAGTAVNGLTEQRADDVRDALRRAMELLEPAQQQAATRVLADHDIDVDSGRPEPTGEEP
jgi:hypothetical protein